MRNLFAGLCLGVLLGLVSCDGVDNINKGDRFDSNDFTYSYLSKDSCAIINGPDYLTDIEIPATVNYEGKTYQVIEVSDGAFKNSGIQSVKLPSTIKRIGNSAFEGCSKLNLVDMSDCYSLYKIGSSSFARCSALQSVDLSHTEIMTVEESVFNSCTSLQSVAFPSTLTEIDPNVFAKCPSLWILRVNSENAPASLYPNPEGFVTEDISVIVPDDLIDIYRENDYWNQFYLITETASVQNIHYKGLNYIHGAAGEATVAENASFSGSLSIPELLYDYSLNKLKVTQITANAFKGCELEYIELPASIKTIGEGAFSNCNFPNITLTLKSLSIVSTGDNVFMGTKGLLGVNFVNCGYLSQLGSGIFKDSQIESFNFEGVPTLLSIGESAFENSNIKNITISSRLQEIGNRAFFNCSRLSSANFANATGLKNLGSKAFAGCSALTSVYLGVTNIETLQEGTFENAGNLRTVTFPESLKVIKNNVFSNCPSLSLINSFPYSVPQCQDMGISKSKMKDITVIVPDDIVPGYESNSYWSQFDIVSEEFETFNYLVHSISYQLGQPAYFYVGETSDKSMALLTSSGGYFSFKNCKITNYGPLTSATNQSIKINATNTFTGNMLTTMNMDPNTGYVVEGTFYTKDHFNRDITKTVYINVYFSDFKSNSAAGYYNPTTMHFQRFRKK